MADDNVSRRKIIERANRLLKQSKSLRKISNELLTESTDIRAYVEQLGRPRNTKGTRKK
jgi:hypothetical protein